MQLTCPVVDILEIVVEYVDIYVTAKVEIRAFSIMTGHCAQCPIFKGKVEISKRCPRALYTLPNYIWALYIKY